MNGPSAECHGAFRGRTPGFQAAQGFPEPQAGIKDRERMFRAERIPAGWSFRHHAPVTRRSDPKRQLSRDEEIRCRTKQRTDHEKICLGQCAHC